jgi:hypothetical protein
MTMPNFIVIGAQKSGTTTMHFLLAQHPRIYMSAQKEPRFFCFEDDPPRFDGPGASRFNRSAVTQLARYRALFDDVAGETAIGESSTDYTTGRHVERTAERMRNRLPDARIIALLRHPADRAYSAFTFARQLNWEPLPDFLQALAAEESPERANWPPNRLYLQNGRYHAQLKPYFDRFPREQIRVYLFEDWRLDPAAVVGDICRFLGVDDTFPFDHSMKRKETWRNRSATLHRLMEQPGRATAALATVLPRRLRRYLVTNARRFNRAAPPRLDPAVRYLLTLSYREQILRLQDLLARDLTRWLA